ncbi:DUF3800 domain-containing protein [Dermatobacter hominis]|uniref:DUF3800 domain-containing protein n=1 Tax=Dermatobacter hominis TaxID=2884263 RepID=UPI001D1037BC|nr:DUF3800 domain-containing protein [Dermatobacter hominis]UDY34032.1 DUF3800 domain-containing protein [Dermatobacter hominis]
MALLFHIDESIESNRFHVHLGLLADGPGVAGATTRLETLADQVRQQQALVPYPLEFHGYEMLQRVGAWSWFSYAEIFGFYEEALRALQLFDIEVIIRAADLDAVSRRRGASFDVYEPMFSNLLERLNERCRNRCEHGLVVADEQQQYGPVLQKLLYRWQRTGTGGYRAQVLDRVLDAAHFVDSKLSRMIQLADLAAYVERRRRATPHESHSQAEAAMARFHQMVTAAVPSPQGQYRTLWVG